MQAPPSIQFPSAVELAQLSRSVNRAPDFFDCSIDRRDGAGKQQVRRVQFLAIAVRGHEPRLEPLCISAAL